VRAIVGTGEIRVGGEGPQDSDIRLIVVYFAVFICRQAPNEAQALQTHAPPPETVAMMAEQDHEALNAMNSTLAKSPVLVVRVLR
jgi:hypothetical protein